MSFIKPSSKPAFSGIYNKGHITTSGDKNTRLLPLISLDNVSFAINRPIVMGGVSEGSTQLNSKGLWANARSEQHKKPLSVNTHITKTNPSKVLLHNISVDILPNEKISVIGPNGAGKSTLMKLMLGLIQPTTGKITRHKHLNIGYVPQKFTVPAILPLRVQDLLAQVKKGITKDEQALLYDRLSINPLLKQQVIHLSGGETQRVLLTRSLLSKPNLLILDEPMQGLDPDSEAWLYEFIDELPDFLQCAMVVVSHDLHWVMRGSRRVICLNKHICCEGQPSDLSNLDAFKTLFGHQYEQPYIHRPHDCQHHGVITTNDASRF